MGKPYKEELAKLSETYEWSLGVDIKPLVEAVASSSARPLICIGSGGSFSVAHLACYLHQHYTGMLSRPMTPLEFISTGTNVRAINVMIISAGGSNGDILAAFDSAVHKEPRGLNILCLRRGSKLSVRAKAHTYVDLWESTPPFGKDGFLATNSLLAFSTLLYRAYAAAYSTEEQLPRKLDQLVSKKETLTSHFVERDRALETLWQRRTLLVLHGSSIAPAAIDIESRFSEAALGNVQLADFRNFAHGRHHWLDKHAKDTAVLALYTKSEEVLANRLLRLFPAGIPVGRMPLSQAEPIAGLEAMLSSLHIAGFVGKHRSIDPGRPGVPVFGRRIYNLKTLGTLNKRTSMEDLAIARKLNTDVACLDDVMNVDAWRKSYRQFIKGLTAAKFKGVAFDYDGTLCDPIDRFSGVRDEVARHLQLLLSKGIQVGIATGRGDSVRDALRKAVPRKHWNDLLIGYYNGTEIARLSDDSHPSQTTKPSKALTQALALCENQSVLANLATTKLGATQLTIKPRVAHDTTLLWRYVQQMAWHLGLMAVQSSHSMDVLERTSSKAALVKAIQQKIVGDNNVLCIGDQAQFPGNDFELLDLPFGLSVDESSVSPESGWNLCPTGSRGVQGCLYYLDSLVYGDKGFGIQLKSSSKG